MLKVIYISSTRQLTQSKKAISALFLFHLLHWFRLIVLSILSQVGLFRKSGVKSRIQALRQQCELSPDFVSYEDQSAYDVADMVKQFFRDLPEPLLTSKLGETFLHIYQCKSPWSNECCNMLSQLKSSAFRGCECEWF